MVAKPLLNKMWPHLPLFSIEMLRKAALLSRSTFLQTFRGFHKPKPSAGQLCCLCCCRKGSPGLGWAPQGRSTGRPSSTGGGRPPALGSAGSGGGGGGSNAGCGGAPPSPATGGGRPPAAGRAGGGS
uniref:Uncharacterized protein n=1 Tax=Amphimedon queenslandica TaxID=400682 RepID=A0A1X7TBE6_AMPQE